ncbi:exosortase/archaeosortase family protein [Streptacidiphilus sp. EB129]
MRTGARPGAGMERPAAVVVLAAAVAMLVWSADFRAMESDVAALMFRPFSATSAAPSMAIVYFGGEGTGAFGLQITPECSAALVIAPLAMVCAAVLWTRRVPTRRVLEGIALAALIIAVSNLLRVGLIAALMSQLGLATGYQLGHLVLGSLMSLLFIAAGLAVVGWRISTGPSRDGAASC